MIHVARRLLVRIGLVLALAVGSGQIAQAQSFGSALVFAASSMTDAMNAAGAAYAETGETAPTFSFASSSVLARQIGEGAPADLFISASREWMDQLVTDNAVAEDAPVDIAGNAIVIAGPRGTEPADDAAAALGDDRFAMGDPSHVPAGIYARSSLEKLGVWTSVMDKAVIGENVRVALELASRGEVSRAIVYASDLKAAPDLATVFTLPADSHDPILYPAAVPIDAPNAEAGEAFLGFLQSEVGQAILEEYGFTAP